MKHEIFNIDGFKYGTQYDAIASAGDYVVFSKTWGKKMDGPILRKVNSIHRKSENHAFNYMMEKVVFTDNPNIKL